MVGVQKLLLHLVDFLMSGYGDLDGNRILSCEDPLLLIITLQYVWVAYWVLISEKSILNAPIFLEWKMNRQ